MGPTLYQIQNKPLNFCQSGNISPNLVTLLTFYKGKVEKRATGVDEESLEEDGEGGISDTEDTWDTMVTTVATVMNGRGNGSHMS